MDRKSPRRTWIMIVIILLILVFLIFVMDLDDLVDAFRDLKFEPLVLGALFMIFGMFLISVRWRYLLDNRVSLKITFHTDAISYMIRMFTPVYVPVLRVATISIATPFTTSQVTPGIMAERLLELVMRLVALVVAAILVSTSDIASNWVIVWVLLLAALFGGLVYFANRAGDYLPRLSTWLTRFERLDKSKIDDSVSSLEAGLHIVGSTRRLLLSLLLSILMWSCFLAGYGLILDSLDLNLNYAELFAAAAALLVVLPPSTPAMIGIFQGVTVTVLLPFQFTDTSNLIAYGILLYAVMAIFWTVSGYWGYRQTRLNIKELIRLRGFNKDRPDNANNKADQSSL